MMRSGRRITGAFIAAAAAVCVMSSGLNGAGIAYAATVTSGQEQAEKPEMNGEAPEAKGTRCVGKITAVTSSSITVQLGEMNRPEKKDGEKPEKPADGERPEKPAEGQLPELPANGELPELPANGEQPAGAPEMNVGEHVTLTDETKTISISDETKVRSKGQETAASDLAEGTYISFLLDDDGNVIEISTDLMTGGHGGHGGRGRGGKKPEESAASSES